MKIYKADIVRKLEVFYAHEIKTRSTFSSVAEHLTALAHRMHEGIMQSNEAVLAEISNYHPAYLGRSIIGLLDLDLTLIDCQKTIANEYGFRDWVMVLLQQDGYHHEFEQAVDYLLSGNLEMLKEHIAASPGLLDRKSQYGHKASLLHYCGSNGVEFWRQIVPYNLPSMLAFLLSEGADKKAKMRVYGGEFTTLQLVTSSAHPYEAGLAKDLQDLLED